MLNLSRILIETVQYEEQFAGEIAEPVLDEKVTDRRTLPEATQHLRDRLGQVLVFRFRQAPRPRGGGRQVGALLMLHREARQQKKLGEDLIVD